MRKIVAAGMGLLTLTGAATAADLPAKAPVYKAPIVEPWTWTGVYIGLNAGYSWGRSSTTESVFDNTTNALLFTANNSFNMNGGIAGGQIGANWQSGVWVVGIEADVQWSGQKGGTSFTCPAQVCNNTTAIPAAATIVSGAFDQRLQWFGTLRGRFGVALVPTVFGYVTGGLAYGDIETDAGLSGFDGGGAIVTNAVNSITAKAGWTVGAGVEARLGGNWSGKLEYLYMDLGTVSTAVPLLTNSPPIYATWSSRITDNIVRVGFNYKFTPY
jgi:outer membrane immunogenic protein